MANHRVQCPNRSLSWHNDADHVFGPEMNYVEVFYFPQDTSSQMGSTEVIPGSHIHRRPADPYEAGGPCEGPAGTFDIHVQTILPRRSESITNGVRHMLKFNYWRTVRPSATGLSSPTLTCGRPITAAMAWRASRPTCSTGCVARVRRFTRWAGRPGPGPAGIRSARPTVSAWPKATFPTGARMVRTCMPFHRPPSRHRDERREPEPSDGSRPSNDRSPSWICSYR